MTKQEVDCSRHPISVNYAARRKCVVITVQGLSLPPELTVRGRASLSALWLRLNEDPLTSSLTGSFWRLPFPLTLTGGVLAFQKYLPIPF